MIAEPGRRHPEPARPGPNTLYDAASLTKLLATWPLIGLTDSITTDTTVRDLLPDLPDEAPGANVTVGQILAHTSGPGIQQLLHVLPALGVAAARDVR